MMYLERVWPRWNPCHESARCCRRGAVVAVAGVPGPPTGKELKEFCDDWSHTTGYEQWKRSALLGWLIL